MGYPNYPPQAKTKDECKKAMVQKIVELRREIAFFERGLGHITPLEEKNFYELTKDDGIVMFVQCWGLGRDHVRFRLFACSVPQSEAKLSSDEFSLVWTPNWSVKAIDPKDSSLYVGYVWKTEHYDKLLKGKYRSLPKGA
jgi:hypothetical protein